MNSIIIPKVIVKWNITTLLLRKSNSPVWLKGWNRSNIPTFFICVKAHVCVSLCVRRLELIKIYHLFQGYLISIFYFSTVFIELLPLHVLVVEPCIILFEGAKHTHVVNICIRSFWRYQPKRRDTFIGKNYYSTYYGRIYVSLWINYKGGQLPKKKGM